MLDVWNRDAIVCRFAPERTWAALPDLDVAERRAFDPLSGRLTVHYTYRYAAGHTATHDGDFRLYTAAELRVLCAGAGLTVAACYGTLTGAHYTLDIPRLVVLARRPA